MEKPTRSRDTNKLAYQVVGESVGLKPRSDYTPKAKDPKAVERGKIRAEKLSPNRRKEIAKKAVIARWSKKQ